LTAGREYLTHWAVAGAFIALTGFAPEHWVADLVIAIPESLRHGWLPAFDIRIGLVAVGVAIIAWDVLRRGKPEMQGALLDSQQETPELVRTPDQSGDDQKQLQATKVATLALPDKPSIAVLPFQNMSGDPEQEIFADGLVEDIITTLSKLSGLRVIARNSSFLFKGHAVDVRKVAAELGVRYVLDGSVQKTADRIRITAQLIDATNGTHLWAERYDRAIDDIFAIQDEITLILATEMQVSLTEGEQARLRYSTTNNVEAWTHWVQGLSHYRQPVTKEQFGAARPCWEKALALDPTSAALHALLGFVHYADARFGWWDDRETALGKARAYADRALALDPENADAYTTSSLVLMMRGRYDEAVAHARRAAQLAPGAADAATFACFVLASSGYPEEAVVQIERAMTLSPNYPANYLGHLGNAYRLSGRIEEAITAFKAYDARNPGFGLTDLVIAYQQSDQPEQAKRTAEHLLSVRRGFTIASWVNTQFRSDTAQLEADIAALRAAGLPMN
jgi:adenylate cyclase